jgi:hypothetical protein
MFYFFPKRNQMSKTKFMVPVEALLALGIIGGKI